MACSCGGSCGCNGQCSNCTCKKADVGRCQCGHVAGQCKCGPDCPTCDCGKSLKPDANIKTEPIAQKVLDESDRLRLEKIERMKKRRNPLAHVTDRLVRLADVLDQKEAYEEAEQLTKIAQGIIDGRYLSKDEYDAYGNRNVTSPMFWVWNWVEGGYNGESARFLGLDRNEALERAKAKAPKTRHIDEKTFRLVPLAERMRMVQSDPLVGD